MIWQYTLTDRWSPRSSPPWREEQRRKEESSFLMIPQILAQTHQFQDVNHDPRIKASSVLLTPSGFPDVLLLPLPKVLFHWKQSWKIPAMPPDPPDLTSLFLQSLQHTNLKKPHYLFLTSSHFYFKIVSLASMTLNSVTVSISKKELSSQLPHSCWWSHSPSRSPS